MSTVATHFTPVSEARTRFAEAPGYLSACTSGLPTRETLAAMSTFTQQWATGAHSAVSIGAEVDQCRSLFAGIASVTPDRVAVGSQTSQLVSVIAASLPDGAEVLCAAGDFSSLTHPFEQQRHRGVRVRYVPVAELASAMTPGTSLVAFSLVQSATGEVAQHDEIIAAAARVGARTLADLTQSLGWLPVPASLFDYTVCHAYKWLCAPRGTAFLTVAPGLEESLVPVAAGWYSAEDVWESCYAGHTPLAPNATRFDLSPAWPVIGGTVAALSFISAIDPHEAQAHGVGLANAARAELGLPASNSAILAWPDPDGSALAAMRASGITASGRLGNARVSFHLWNTEADVELLARSLRH